MDTLWATNVQTFATTLLPGNSGTGGVITYTDTNGLNPVASPPYIGGYVVHTFTNTGSSTLSIPINVTGSVLVVAGGGGGGFGSGGGRGCRRRDIYQRIRH